MGDHTLRAAVIGGGLGSYHGYAYDRSPGTSWRPSATSTRR